MTLLTTAAPRKWPFYASEEWYFLHGSSDATMRTGVFYAVHPEKLKAGSVNGQGSGVMRQPS
jgi:hypothetical protein